MVGRCKDGNEPSGYVKYEEFLDCVITGQIPKKDCSME